MKNNLTITLILILLTGCGAFNKKDLNNEKLLGIDERVDYNGTGEYDLSDYLFPSVNKVLIYRETTFKRANNQQDFDYENPEDTNNKVNNYVREGNIVKLNDNTEYIINIQSIEKKALIDGNYDNRKFRRHLNLGDIYYSFEYVELKGTTYRRVGKMICKIVEHNETKEILNQNYKDILQLTCEGKFVEGTIDKSFSIEKTFHTTSFYAKNIGLIGNILLKDETRVTGNERYNEGKRIETLLSN